MYEDVQHCTEKYHAHTSAQKDTIVTTAASTCYYTLEFIAKHLHTVQFTTMKNALS